LDIYGLCDTVSTREGSQGCIEESSVRPFEQIAMMLMKRNKSRSVDSEPDSGPLASIKIKAL
jgi:hypothetical protein